MVGEETLAGRAFVRADHDGVAQQAHDLLANLTDAETAELEDILGRYGANVEKAMALDEAWQRGSLCEAIRRDLFDLLRYGLVHRDPDLSAACGRALANIDRRSQAEASPGFDCAA